LKYWDSSALVPLLFQESGTRGVVSVHAADPDQTVWCLTDVEIVSALARRLREGLAADRADAIRSDIKRYSDRWSPVDAVELVRRRALRIVQTHPLRAADGLQLAAALVACDERPEALPFVCLDDRLRDAARREGFPVLP
jgi:uncharacterized protein